MPGRAGGCRRNPPRSLPRHRPQLLPIPEPRCRERQAARPGASDVTALVVAFAERTLYRWLGHAEVVGIARSVNRYQRENLATGQQRRFAFIQSCRGKRSGKARRLATAGRDAEIVGAVARGESQAAIAAAFGVAQQTVSYTSGERVARGPRWCCDPRGARTCAGGAWTRRPKPKAELPMNQNR